MFKFTNKISEEDFVEFNIFHMNNSKTMNGTKLGINLLFPMMFFLFGLVSGKELDLLFWIIMLVGSIFLFLMIPKIMNSSLRKRLKKMMLEGDNGDMFAEKEYIIDELGIKMNSANSSGFYNWNSVIKVDEDEKNMYLFVSTVQALIIPKMIIKGQVNIDEFRIYIFSKLTK